jgi:AraC-like DNA-binding protein
MADDPLTDALALAGATGIVSGALTATGRWAVRFRPRARLKVTAVLHGSCRMLVDDATEPIELTEGDVAVLNGRGSELLATDLSAEPVDGTALFAASAGRLVTLPAAGDDASQTVVVGGHVQMNQVGDDLLLAALAPLSVIPGTAPTAPAIGWLLDRVVQELTTGRPGAELALRQYAQLLFLEVMRALLGSPDGLPSGWLRLLTDQRLAPAVRSMHADPARAWHLNDLARSATMSRTAFAARFTAVAGMPPLTYLQHWRIRLAQQALRQGDTSVAALAASLGYTSESAFSTAFKRRTGMAPRNYRTASREQRDALT